MVLNPTPGKPQANPQVCLTLLLACTQEAIGGLSHWRGRHLMEACRHQPYQGTCFQGGFIQVRRWISSIMIMQRRKGANLLESFEQTLTIKVMAFIHLLLVVVLLLLLLLLLMLMLLPSLLLLVLLLLLTCRSCCN